MADIRTSMATKAPAITIIRTNINTNILTNTAMATIMDLIAASILMKEVTNRFNFQMALEFVIYCGWWVWTWLIRIRNGNNNPNVKYYNYTNNYTNNYKHHYHVDHYHET